MKIYLILLTIVVFVSACSTDSDSPIELNTYNNSEIGLTVGYPSDWVTIDTITKGFTPVIVASNHEDAERYIDDLFSIDLEPEEYSMSVIGYNTDTARALMNVWQPDANPQTIAEALYIEFDSPRVTIQSPKMVNDDGLGLVLVQNNDGDILRALGQINMENGIVRFQIHGHEDDENKLLEIATLVGDSIEFLGYDHDAFNAGR